MEKNATNIIELVDVCKEFDGVSVIDNMNLYVRKGEFVTFLGPSGCGKTTTLRMIAGFEMPTSGKILLNGQDISSLPPNQRRLTWRSRWKPSLAAIPSRSPWTARCRSLP